MDKNELFGWLVRYHNNVNLERSLRHFNSGRILDSDDRPIEEGIDENEHYKGALIVANGDTLAARLREDRVALTDPEPFFPIHDQQDLTAYLLDQKNGDGAYVVDGVHDQIARVRVLSNDHPNFQKVTAQFKDLVPANFASYDGTVDPEANLGTKTWLAAYIPQAYDNTHTFQIKRTAFTDLGMGIVTHFDRDGLKEKYFLKFDPESKGPFILQRYGIVGVYHGYERQDGKLVRVVERLVEGGTPLFHFGVASKTRSQSQQPVNYTT